MLKHSIQAFVQMGFITADIVKQDDDYVWKGEKNLFIYEKNFEDFLIQKVRFVALKCIVKRGVQSKESGMDMQL